MRTALRLGAFCLAVLVALGALGGHACPAAAAPVAAADSPCPGHQPGSGAPDPEPSAGAAPCAMACGGGTVPLLPVLTRALAVIEPPLAESERIDLPFVVRLPEPIPIV